MLRKIESSRSLNDEPRTYQNKNNPKKEKEKRNAWNLLEIFFTP